MIFAKKKNKTDELIKESIALAVEKLTDDMEASTNAAVNIDRAKAIQLLMDAYSVLKFGG